MKDSDTEAGEPHYQIPRRGAGELRPVTPQKPPRRSKGQGDEVSTFLKELSNCVSREVQLAPDPLQPQHVESEAPAPPAVSLCQRPAAQPSARRTSR